MERVYKGIPTCLSCLTPHSTTQRSQAELLHGRPMRTKLHVAGRPLPANKTLSSRQVALRVRETQKKRKAYTDHKRGAKAVFFRVGSYVWVKKPGILAKTQCKFSKPLKPDRTVYLPAVRWKMLERILPRTCFSSGKGG